MTHTNEPTYGDRTMSTADFLATAGSDALKKMPASKLQQLFKRERSKNKMLERENEVGAAKLQDLMEEVISTAEEGLTLALGSGVEGYYGADKLKIGGVDGRLAGGIVLGGYGLYQHMAAEPGQSSGASHALSLGKGLLYSYGASVMVGAGQALSEAQLAKKNQTAQAQTQVTQSAPAPAALPDPQVNGPLREIVLTPEPDPVPINFQVAGDHDQPAGRSNRFVRASVRD